MSLRYGHLIPRLDVKPCPAGYLLIASVNISTQDPEHVFVAILIRYIICIAYMVFFGNKWVRTRPTSRNIDRQFGLILEGQCPLLRFSNTRYYYDYDFIGKHEAFWKKYWFWNT